MGMSVTAVYLDSLPNVGIFALLAASVPTSFEAICCFIRSETNCDARLGGSDIA